jgi:hypothetical protein
MYANGFSCLPHLFADAFFSPGSTSSTTLGTVQTLPSMAQARQRATDLYLTWLHLLSLDKYDARKAILSSSSTE